MTITIDYTKFYTRAIHIRFDTNYRRTACRSLCRAVSLWLAACSDIPSGMSWGSLANVICLYCRRSCARIWPYGINAAGGTRSYVAVVSSALARRTCSRMDPCSARSSRIPVFKKRINKFFYTFIETIKKRWKKQVTSYYDYYRFRGIHAWIVRVEAELVIPLLDSGVQRSVVLAEADRKQKFLLRRVAK